MILGNALVELDGIPANIDQSIEHSHRISYSFNGVRELKEMS